MKNITIHLIRSNEDKNTDAKDRIGEELNSSCCDAPKHPSDITETATFSSKAETGNTNETACETENELLLKEIAALRNELELANHSRHALEVQIEQINKENKEKEDNFIDEINLLKNTINLRNRSLNGYRKNEKLPEKIRDDLSQLNESFGDITVLIRNLMDKVTYGDKGIKELCKLHSTIYHIEGNPYISYIVENISAILTDSFDVIPINPSQGEAFDSIYHEATEYNPYHTVVDTCLRPGWMYNGKVIIRATVKTI